nr:acyltransferase [Bacteriovorax sp. HI3]
MNAKVNPLPDIPLRLPPVLSWLRLLAVLLVFSGHSKTLFGRGHGAIFFMVLSGYTFTRFFIKEWSETGKIRIRRFLSKRLSKLVPALLIVLAINLVIKIWHHHPVDETQFLSVATFTTNYFNALNGHPNNGLAHLWTLSLVMQFYLVWPFVFLLLVNYCHSLKEITIALSLAILAVITYRSVLLYFGLATNAYIFNSFETRVDCFLIGALFAFNIECSLFQKIRQLAFKYKLSVFMTMVVITLMTSLPLIMRNSFGFDLHAFLIGLFIVQLGALDDLSFGILGHSELLSDITYWFYLLHPWGNTLGDMMKMNPYAQFLFGGTILLMCVTLFCYTLKEARVSSKVSNLFR